MRVKLIFRKALNVVKQPDYPAVSSSPLTDDSSGFSLDLMRTISVIARNWRLIAATTLAIMVLCAGIVLLLPNEYTSRATILPSGNTDQFAALRQVAGLAGISNSPNENSSELFPTVMRSQRVYTALLNRTYPITRDQEIPWITLDEYLEQDNPDKLRGAMNKLIDIDQSRQTGVITVYATTRYPLLSQGLLKEMLASLEDFNTTSRQSSAKANVKYLSRELAKHQKELQLAEDSLEAFQLANQNWARTTDPTIQKKVAQLTRSIQMKGTTYALLREQYELAKLDEQKDIPIVQVLDAPNLPTVKSAPKRGLMTILAGLLGCLMACVYVVGVDQIRIRKLTHRLGIEPLADNFERMSVKPRVELDENI